MDIERIGWWAGDDIVPVVVEEEKKDDIQELFDEECGRSGNKSGDHFLGAQIAYDGH